MNCYLCGAEGCPECEKEEDVMSVSETTNKFRKGQRLHLDSIYAIQGLGGGDWWDHDTSRNGNEEDGDFIIITKSIDITVRVRTYERQSR